MSENPYQAPAETPEIESMVEAESDVGPVNFGGGWPAVAGIGVLGGVSFFAVLYLADTLTMSGPTPFLMIGLLWFAALSAVTLMMRGTLLTIGQRLMMALFGAPIGFILYVPICTATTMMISGGYQSDNTALSVGSIFAFTFVLLLLAWSVRTRIRKKQQSQRPAEEAMR